MELTGKANLEFKLWHIRTHFKDLNNNLEFIEKELSLFNMLPDPMKWGVLVDFFDSVGYTIIIESEWNYPKVRLTTDKGIGEQTFCYYVFKPSPSDEGADYDCNFKTRKETRTAAIEQANKLFNERN